MWVGKCVRCPVGNGCMYCMSTLQGCIWEYEAACLQIHSGEWGEPSSVLGLAVPMCLPVPLHNPVQGLEAVCWWESGGLCGLHFKGVLGEILPRREELQDSRSVPHFPCWV